MHILTAQREAVELELVPTSFEGQGSERRLRVESETGSAKVARAARAFLESTDAPRERRAIATLSLEEAPAVFREKASGMLRVVHREIVIRFRPRTSEKRRKQILEKYGYVTVRSNAIVSHQIVAKRAVGSQGGPVLLDVANACCGLDEVEFAAPNFVSQYVRLAAIPKPHPEQWHLENRGAHPGQLAHEDVRALAAWKSTRGRSSITVAVLDDGVDVDHPNLRSRIRKKPDPKEPRDLCGRDFFVPATHPDHFDPRPKRFQYPYDVTEGNDIHGTPCAGVIAAPGRNEGGVGVAPGCRILAVKIFHADELASDERVADAIRYAALHADVLSCSWSGGYSSDIDLAIRDAQDLGRQGKGAAVFCASGNEATNRVAFPARHAEAIAVGASTDQANRARYSNTGPELWVVAPSNGGIRGIFTTDVSLSGRGYNVGRLDAGGVDGLHTNDFGGTSSATPLAAGVAALALSRNPALDRKGLRELLARTADKIGSPSSYDERGHSPEFGYGRVNAAAAVEQATG